LTEPFGQLSSENGVAASKAVAALRIRQTIRVHKKRRPGQGSEGTAMAAGRDQAARAVRDEAPAQQPQPPQSPPSQPLAPLEAAPSAAVPAQVDKSGGRKVLLGVAVLVALGAIAYGVNFYLVGRYFITTDDAYVRANNTTLGARVGGHINAIVVADNAKVHAGDVIVRIDDGDYRIAVDSVRARIGTQQATIERIGQQIAAQTSAVDQAKAQLESAKAGVVRAQADFDRQQALSDRGIASKAAFEGSLAARDQAAASVQSAQAGYNSALAGVEVVKAQQAEAQQQLVELKAQLAKAERDLEFANVRAPVDGYFSNRMVNSGDYVQPGQRLGNIVPLEAIYIDANFKETQLERIKPGQPVKISIDAFSTRKIDGVVESLSPASGAVFSLLPPDNATGNFTKIVQRVPVRIRVSKSVARAQLLRPGMSVYVKVDTGSAPEDPSAALDHTDQP
jgi:membrane fusion protein (multidrug efflux system)